MKTIEPFIPRSRLLFNLNYLIINLSRPMFELELELTDSGAVFNLGSRNLKRIRI